VNDRDLTLYARMRMKSLRRKLDHDKSRLHHKFYAGVSPERVSDHEKALRDSIRHQYTRMDELLQAVCYLRRYAGEV